MADVPKNRTLFCWEQRCVNSWKWRKGCTCIYSFHCHDKNSAIASSSWHIVPSVEKEDWQGLPMLLKTGYSRSMPYTQGSLGSIHNPWVSTLAHLHMHSGWPHFVIKGCSHSKNGHWGFSPKIVKDVLIGWGKVTEHLRIMTNSCP